MKNEHIFQVFVKKTYLIMNKMHCSETFLRLFWQAQGQRYPWRVKESDRSVLLMDNKQNLMDTQQFYT